MLSYCLRCGENTKIISPQVSKAMNGETIMLAKCAAGGSKKEQDLLKKKKQKVKRSNSQLNKLKSAIKNETDVVLKLSSNMISNSDDETNFPHKLLLTNGQVTSLRKAFCNHTSTDIKLSKAQLSKMIQIGGFIGKLLDPLLRTSLPLMKSVIQPLAKSVLISLGLTSAASAADAEIPLKNLRIWS